jgi:adenylate cyclase
MEEQSRHLVAILFTDVVGYTAMMQQNEKLAVAAIKRHNSILEKVASTHHGQVVNYYGDGSLSIFQSATEAIQAALEAQQELQKDPPVPLRIGLHVGEIFFEDGKALGDGVNLASRIQSLGLANTILFSGEIHDKIKNNPEFKSVTLGLFDFKNVDKPIEVFALSNPGLVVPKREQMEGKLKHGANRRSRLRKYILAATIILVAVASYFLYIQFGTGKSYTAKNKSIVVLPFQNMSGNKDNDFFSSGMTEEITTQLAKIADLKVISRTTAMTYKNTKKTVKQIAQELGVTSVLEGSVQQYGDETRITAQLIDGNTEQHIWAEHYDHKNLNDLLTIQSDVSLRIAQELNAHLTPEEKNRIEKKATNDPQAYNLYLKGRFFWNIKSEASLKKGIIYFDSAISIDPNFSIAYAGKADCLNALGYSGFDSPVNTFGKAEEAARKALELDSSMAAPHASLGYINFYYNWVWNDAEYHFKKAIELDPKYDLAYDWYGFYLTARERFVEAQIQIGKAMQLDPLSSTIGTDMGWTMYYGGKEDEAIRAFQSALELNPGFTLAHFWLARTLEYKKEYKEALKQYQIADSIFRARDPNGRSWVVTLAALGHVYGMSGQKAAAQKILAKLDEMSATKYVSPYAVGLVYAGMGNMDKAFEYLERALRDRSHWLVWLKLDNRWDPIRNDKRYPALIAKIGLPNLTK